MPFPSRVASFLRNTFRRRSVDARLDRELEGFVELLASEHRGRGLSDEEAMRRALVTVGGVQQVKEEVRDVRIGAWIDSVRQDVRVGLRSLSRAPVFVSTTVITLALGIGSTVVVLAISDAVLVHPLPYVASDRLVTVLHHRSDPVSPLNYLDWRRAMRTFSSLEAAEYWSPTFTEGEPEQVVGLHVTPGLIGMLGMPPMLGRGYTTTDVMAPTREVLIAHSLWRRRFGGDSSVIGRTVNIDNAPYVIVGVMRPRFRFAPFWATGAELWSPLPLDGRLADRGGSSLRVFGRLASGISIETAQHDVDAVTSRLGLQFPGTNLDVKVVSLKQQAIGNTRPALLTLLGAVSFIVLITCVNVAHMVVVRASVRQREVALRVVLGATRGRVMRSALTESALLTIGGGAAGLMVAAVGLRIIGANAPSDLPQLRTLGLGGSTWIIGVVVAAAAAALVGGLPTMLAGDAARTAALREPGRGSTAPRGRHRLRQILIGSEIAFAVVLLTGTALMVRTFAALRAIDPGFEAANVVTMQVPLARSAAAGPELRLSYFNAILDRMRANPSVRAVAMINHLPLAGDEWGVPAYGGTTLDAPPESNLRAIYRVVTPGYFNAMHIQLVRGRDIGPGDDLEHPAVVIVNEALARKLWPEQDAIGKQLTFSPTGGPRPMQTVIGIARDTKQAQWTAASDPELYRPYMQTRAYLMAGNQGTDYLTLVARVTGDPAPVVAAVRRMVRDADPTQPVTHVETLTSIVGRMTVSARFLTAVLVSFATLAIGLAAVGIYGVMAYSVSQRTKEIGIRIALGATSVAVTRNVLDQAIVMTASGLIVGIGGAFALTRFIAGQLYGVQPTDPASFIAAALLLTAVAVLASIIPARRALRLDPVSAIRAE